MKNFNNKLYQGDAIKVLCNKNDPNYSYRTKEIMTNFKKLIDSKMLPCAEEMYLHSDNVNIGGTIVFGKISKFCKPKEALNTSLIHLHIANNVNVNYEGRLTSNESIIYGEYLRNNEKDRYIIVFSIESSHNMSQKRINSLLEEYENAEKRLDNNLKLKKI